MSHLTMHPYKPSVNLRGAAHSGLWVNYRSKNKTLMGYASQDGGSCQKCCTKIPFRLDQSDAVVPENMILGPSKVTGTYKDPIAQHDAVSSTNSCPATHGNMLCSKDQEGVTCTSKGLCCMEGEWKKVVWKEKEISRCPPDYTRGNSVFSSFPNKWKDARQTCNVHEDCKGYGLGNTDRACCGGICKTKDGSWPIGKCP